MANSRNAVQLLGRLGADAELRNTNNGKSVLNWRMATSEQWKDDQGNKQERVEWHSCVMWGNYAAAVAKYMTKGKRLHASGKLQTRKWTDKNNVDRYTTEIVCDDLVLLDGGTDAKQPSAGAPAGGSRDYKPQTQSRRPDNQGLSWDQPQTTDEAIAASDPGIHGADDNIPF
jgi:single-strand DNA-binding protein